MPNLSSSAFFKLRGWLALWLAGLSALVLTLGLLFVASRAAQAAGPLYVAPTGIDNSACTSSGSPCATIQYAIGQAAPGDTIYVAVGTYTVVTGTQVVNITQTLTLSGGWTMTFTTQTGLSTIDAQNVSGRRGMYVPTGVNGTVSNFVIRNGNLPITTTTYGGGVYVLGSLTLSNTTVVSNTAYDGGGIYNSKVLTVTNSPIYSNTAFYGGGIYNSDTLTVTSSSIYRNTAQYAGGISNLYGTLVITSSSIYSNVATTYFGGGIENFNSTLMVVNSYIYSNTAATNGGGIDNDGTLTVTSSSIYSNTAAGYGGGISNYTGMLTVTSSSIYSNTAQYGGGISVNDISSTVTVTGSSIYSNTVSLNGGGISNEGTLMVTGSSIYSNTAVDGGGLYNDGTLTVTGSSIYSNTAQYGGGLYNYGTLTVMNSPIYSNTAQSNGGGLDNYGTLAVTNSLIYSNTAQYGGGILNDSGTLTATNSLIYSNTATLYGGGAYNSQGRLTFANSAITGNQASLGSGLYNYGFPSNVGVITLTNTSLSNNTIYNDGGRIVSPGGLTADFVNAGGAFRPSSSPTQPGSLTITGTFTQTAAGALEFLLAGLTPATQFDQLNVNGQAVLAGSLNISVTANFTPTLGQSFRIINYTSHTGSFGGVSTLALPASVFKITPRGGTRPLWFLPVYDASGVTLVVATPPLYLPFIRR